MLVLLWWDLGMVRSLTEFGGLNFPSACVMTTESLLGYNHRTSFSLTIKTLLCVMAMVITHLLAVAVQFGMCSAFPKA